MEVIEVIEVDGSAHHADCVKLMNDHNLITTHVGLTLNVELRHDREPVGESNRYLSMINWRIKWKVMTNHVVVVRNVSILKN